MLLTLCLLACGPDNLVRPSRPLAVDIQQSVTNSPGCATVVVEVSGSSSASATFPSDSGCHTGLVLHPGGAATYHRPGGGVFTLPVRVVNRSGMAVALPVRLALGSDSAVVLSPPGLAKNGKKGVTPTAPDSALPTGAVWLVGTGASLAAGDSTASRDLTFAWDNGVHQARLGFTASAVPAASGDTTRPVVPNTLFLPTDNPLLVPSPYDSNYQVFRNVMGVIFWDSTTGSTIRAIFARYQAVVIGGLPDINSNSMYIVQVPDPGASLDSLTALRNRLAAEPGVRIVRFMTNGGRIDARTRYPVDAGLAPTRASWFGGGPSAAETWSRVRAPLAWGCETGQQGDSLVSVGILDLYFDGVHRDLSSSVVSVLPPTGTLRPNPSLYAEAANHGTGIAGIVAAEGDNGLFVAGVVWRAKLQLQAFGQGQNVAADPTARLA